MKKILLLLAFGSLAHFSVNACTTFLLQKNGELLFGRNYDWVTGSGMICTNLRGLAKTSAQTGDGKQVSWVSVYGSITFNQYGKEFPTGGMNEKGLVVELMWLEGTRYPAADKRPAIDMLQWIQYQLDNCSTVEEVIATDQQLRIASVGTVPLHYLVADGTGAAATIEFLNGKMVVHKGEALPFPVLTNDTYRSSLQQTGGKINNPSFASNSIDRFAKTCRMVDFFKSSAEAPVDYAFSILDEVSQGDFTKWSIVYDIARKKIDFKTGGQPSRKNLSFSTFDFSCSPVSKSWDLSQKTSGDISHLFTPYSEALNRKIVEISCKETSSQFPISEESQRAAWQYPATISCSK